MEFLKVLGNLKAIKVESPVDKIITQLKQLITSGQLKPGDRLPPERILAERFGVGRGYIREAIMKLEFYGLLKTSPQSGTYISGFSLQILDTIFSDIIDFNKDDFAALIEARYYMESISAKLAAERRTEDDIAQMKDALKEYKGKAITGQLAIDEDMLFHIKIAAAAKNAVIESMLLILVPDLIKNILEKEVCKHRPAQVVIAEHQRILDAIINQDITASEREMQKHLRDIMEARKSFK